MHTYQGLVRARFTGTSLGAARLYPQLMMVLAAVCTSDALGVPRCKQDVLPPAFAFTVLVTVFAADAESEAALLHAIGAVGYIAVLMQVCARGCAGLAAA